MSDLDEKIEKIFREQDIDGDIGFDEEEKDFWKRKIVELYDKLKKQK